MIWFCFGAFLAGVAANVCNDTASTQILTFKDEHPFPVGVMTTSFGAPIEYRDTKSLNSKLLLNNFFLDSITHLVRERIAERVVHAKGAGAFGYFEVTHDLSDICKTKAFDTVGKKTPIAARFSSISLEKGGIDVVREGRGFAVKFYTEEGNFDIVGLNTPMFVIRDPVLFPGFVRALKRNPVTDLKDPNMMWDFLTLRPETLFVFLHVFSDRGIPDGHRHMPGFGVHTFQVENSIGETHFIKFHFTPEAGIKNLKSEEANKIAACDPDYATRDLYNAIGTGNFPCWKAYIQVLTPHDVKTAEFDVFDITKVLPIDRYPLRQWGRLVLNRNPKNFFADIEQLAFCPSNLVPGILGAPDKLFEARAFSYRDAHNYRLGANFFNIPVNCPLQAKAYAYNRDGDPPVNDNYDGIPNYYPNSFNGPALRYKRFSKGLVDIYENEPNNFDQARDLYVNEMTSDERTRTVKNIVTSLRCAAEFLQERAVKLFGAIHKDLGNRISRGLQANRTEHSCCC